MVSGWWRGYSRQRDTHSANAENQWQRHSRDVDLDNLFADDAIRDPYAFFGRLREIDPVHWNARHYPLIITRHADVVSIVRDHESFSSAVIKSDARPPYPPLDDEGLTLLDEVRRFRGAQLVEQDPPRHGNMRRLLHQYFTASAIEQVWPFIRSAVAELLDELESGATIDVIYSARGATAGSRDRASAWTCPRRIARKTESSPTSPSTSIVGSRIDSPRSSKGSAGSSITRHHWPSGACTSPAVTSSRSWPKGSAFGSWTATSCWSTARSCCLPDTRPQ